MTPEQKQQQIEQIREHQKRRSYALFQNGRSPMSDDTYAETEFLLSLVKSMEVLARELALIVDVGTCDDPGAALSKLHKIQHVAAASMRSACVEKVAKKANSYQTDADNKSLLPDYRKQMAFAASALREAVKELESLSIEKPKE